MKNKELIKQLYNKFTLPKATKSNYSLAGRICKWFPSEVIQECLDELNVSSDYSDSLAPEERTKVLLLYLQKRCEWKIVDKNITTDAGNDLVGGLL